MPFGTEQNRPKANERNEIGRKCPKPDGSQIVLVSDWKGKSKDEKLTDELKLTDLDYILITLNL